MNVLRQTFQLMEIKEIVQIDAVMLICDADNKSAEEKKKGLLALREEADNFSLNETTMELDVKVKKIPVHTFVFPDNVHSGNLENLLLETAENVYPELLEWASEYVEKASHIQKSLKREQDVKKAKIGCIANVMKPGKANQVSIADDDWVSENTLKSCKMLQALDRKLKDMICLTGEV